MERTRVLMAEDTDGVIQLAQAIIEADSLQIHLTACGTVFALRRCATEAANAESFDVALIDLGLPFIDANDAVHEPVGTLSLGYIRDQLMEAGTKIMWMSVDQRDQVVLARSEFRPFLEAGDEYFPKENLRRVLNSLS